MFFYWGENTMLLPMGRCGKGYNVAVLWHLGRHSVLQCAACLALQGMHVGLHWLHVNPSPVLHVTSAQQKCQGIHTFGPAVTFCSLTGNNNETAHSKCPE